MAALHLPLPYTDETPTIRPLRNMDINARAASVGAMLVGATAVGIAACGGPADPAAIVMGMGGLVLAAGSDRARACLQETNDRGPIAYIRAWSHSVWAIRDRLATPAWAEAGIDPHAPAAIVQIAHVCAHEVRQLVRLRRAQRRSR